MARPRSWFEIKESKTAKVAARKRGHKLFKWIMNTRQGPVVGYYVGKKIPSNLKRAIIKKV
jgi:hypothetical protein